MSNPSACSSLHCAPWMILLHYALFTSFLLMVPSHCIVDPTSTTLAISQAASTVCGITTNLLHHSVQCTRFPEPPYPTVPAVVYPMIPFDAISGGQNFICSLSSGGSSFYCWDGIGKLVKRVYKGPSVLAQLSVEARNVAAINGNRTKIRWWRHGCSLQKRKCSRTAVYGTNFKFLTSGNNFSCVLNSTNGVRCWGPGANIQDSFSSMNFTNITAGGSRLCGMNEQGHLRCTGDKSLVPSGEPYEFTSLAIGTNHTCAISRRNGSVICWGQHGAYFPVGRTSFEIIVAGGDLTCGLTTDVFVVICWGLNGTNTSVMRSFSKILPGVCVLNKTLCYCGVYPDSGDLCGGSGFICKKYGTATTDSCQFLPKNKWKIVMNGWLGYTIVSVVIGTFFMGLFIVYWCFEMLREE